MQLKYVFYNDYYNQESLDFECTYNSLIIILTKTFPFISKDLCTFTTDYLPECNNAHEIELLLKNNTIRFNVYIIEEEDLDGIDIITLNIFIGLNPGFGDDEKRMI